MVTFEPRDVAQDDGKALLGLAHAYDSGARPLSHLTSNYVINVARESLNILRALR